MNLFRMDGGLIRILEEATGDDLGSRLRAMREIGMTTEPKRVHRLRFRLFIFTGLKHQP